eukprot:1321087-Amorphochlora_amoeboformis.AAC.1
MYTYIYCIYLTFIHPHKSPTHTQLNRPPPKPKDRRRKKRKKDSGGDDGGDGGKKDSKKDASDDGKNGKRKGKLFKPKEEDVRGGEGGVGREREGEI